ncbi:type III secretion system chaperone [Bordetella genomosp. 11]|uniref:Type III secretion system chaperone n=1 Tax=Bordetella genomosp. 11 TaxID=1416808 RepID=A0A261UJJ2_9BORD|nr:type III secretion system chaperone [Bordetella genomosp. 11]OZI62086.1 hypothetical protein CAL28_22950 [Bordetella genomosp. 11]
MDAHKLIALFGEESGVPLTLGESGTIDLIFDNDVTVTLEHDDPQDMLHVYTVLGQEPAETEQQLALYRDMLSANAFGHETEGAALSLDDRTGEILLTRRLELADSTVTQLRRIVESMVDVSMSWREKLSTLCHTLPAPPAGMNARAAPPGSGLRA